MNGCDLDFGIIGHYFYHIYPVVTKCFDTS